MPLLPIELAIKAVLIAAGTASVLRILNVRTAAARHAAWAGVVVVMLLLPVWTVWGPKVALHWLPPLPERTATYVTAAGMFEPALGSPPLVLRHPSWNWTACLIGIYAIGMAVFLARLALGTLQAQLLVHRAFRSGGKLFSGACGAPVTVGWLRPLVVLPESWSRWPAAQLDAVLTHEHEHARRRDPLFQWLALLNRALFWFHPLAWWLERRMAALAEEACDAVVLAHGHDPRDYSKYLIDMARSVSSSGVRIQVWGVAMPGGFLEERIRRILEGGPLPRLSRARLVCACMACAATSAAFATSTLDHQRPARQPVRNLILAQIQPQAPAFLPVPAAIPDAPGVTVSADRILHRDPVEYPADALDKGVEGTVILNLSLAPDGTVSDAAVISGPLELRKAVLSSALKWHFSKDAAPWQQVSVEFKLSEAKATAAREAREVAPPPTAGAMGGIYRVGGGIAVKLENAPAAAAPSGNALTDVPRTLHVDIQGLSAEAAAELRQRLALQEGEVFDHAAFVKELERIHQIVSEFDPHLNDSRAVGKVARKTGADGKVVPPDSMDVTVIIAPRDSAPQGELQQFAKIAKPPSLENVPIKLHIDIRGLSPEAAAELRQRLSFAEGETTDLEALRKTVARIRQVMKYFDPRLTDEMNYAFRCGADGQPIPGDSVAATLFIRLKP